VAPRLTLISGLGGVPFRLLLPHSLACLLPYFGRKVFAGRFSEGVSGSTSNRLRISSKLSQNLPGACRQRGLRIQQQCRAQASQTNSRNRLIITTTPHIVNHSSPHRRKCQAQMFRSFRISWFRGLASTTF